jgi:hypothetical protein
MEKDKEQDLGSKLTISTRTSLLPVYPVFHHVSSDLMRYTPFLLHQLRDTTSRRVPVWRVLERPAAVGQTLIPWPWTWLAGLRIAVRGRPSVIPHSEENM